MQARVSTCHEPKRGHRIIPGDRASGVGGAAVNGSAAACSSHFLQLLQIPLQERLAVRGPLYLYELMFDSKTTLTGRLTDAVDLLIDFATLGEYGLEPVGRTSPSCETRRRTANTTRPTSPRRRDLDRPFLLRP